jgi:hypothetical protein
VRLKNVYKNKKNLASGLLHRDTAEWSAGGKDPAGSGHQILQSCLLSYGTGKMSKYIANEKLEVRENVVV